MTAARRKADTRSDAALKWRRWYWTPRWRAKARAQLRAEPLCAIHLKAGQVVPATVCDHVLPHRGDERLFWHGQVQSLCATCHSGQKQREEHGRGPQVLDAAGWPADRA